MQHNRVLSGAGGLTDREVRSTLVSRRFSELLGVISGPLDADKLDYFARDSYFSGMRSLVDLDRVLQTLTITGDGTFQPTLTAFNYESWPVPKRPCGSHEPLRSTCG